MNKYTAFIILMLNWCGGPKLQANLLSRLSTDS